MVKHIRSFYLNKCYFLGIKIISSVNNIFDLACQVRLEVKNLLANAGDTRDIGSIPLSRRSPEGEHGYPLTPVFLPGEFHGQKGMVGCSPKGHKESDNTEGTSALYKGEFNCHIKRNTTLTLNFTTTY